MYEKSKFRFSEVFNNTDGKTSGSAFLGIVMGIATTISFLIILAGWWIGKSDVLSVFDKSLQLGILGAALLGIRKVSGSLSNSKSKASIDVDSDQEPPKIK